MYERWNVDAEAAAVGFFEDVRPLKGGAGELDWLLCGALSRLVADKRLTGAAGEVALLTSNGKIPAPKIFLFGLGPRSGGVSAAAMGAAARAAAERIRSSGVARVVMDFFPLGDDVGETVLAAVRTGLREGAAGADLSIRLFEPGCAPGHEQYEGGTRSSA